MLGVKPPAPAPQPEQLVVPVEPQPGDVPLPPRRQQAQGLAAKPQASLVHPPRVIAGARQTVPAGLSAYAPLDR